MNSGASIRGLESLVRKATPKRYSSTAYASVGLEIQVILPTLDTFRLYSQGYPLYVKPLYVRQIDQRTPELTGRTNIIETFIVTIQFRDQVPGLIEVNELRARRL